MYINKNSKVSGQTRRHMGPESEINPHTYGDLAYSRGAIVAQ